MHSCPGGQRSAARVRVAPMKTVGQYSVVLTFLRTTLRLILPRTRRFTTFFLTVTFVPQARSATATVLFALPPCGNCVFQTSLPVSAFRATAQPRLVAA